MRFIRNCWWILLEWKLNWWFSSRRMGLYYFLITSLAALIFYARKWWQCVLQVEHWWAHYRCWHIKRDCSQERKLGMYSFLFQCIIGHLWCFCLKLHWNFQSRIYWPHSFMTRLAKTIDMLCSKEEITLMLPPVWIMVMLHLRVVLILSKHALWELEGPSHSVENVWLTWIPPLLSSGP